MHAATFFVSTRRMLTQACVYYLVRTVDVFVCLRVVFAYDISAKVNRGPGCRLLRAVSGGWRGVEEYTQPADERNNIRDVQYGTRNSSNSRLTSLKYF